MITIIIPTYNEEENILQIQKDLDHLKGEFEVIFSDGFSTDKTFEKIYYPKIQEMKYRSNQMNRGAEYAKGDILWFVHGDSRISPESVLQIERSGNEIGCFTLEFISAHPLMRMVAFNSSQRVKYRNIAFGDQGIFVKKKLFEEIGGFQPIPLMEDYQLSMTLKKKGYKFHLLKEKIRTSSRRFEEHGIWRTILKMQILQHRYRRHGDIKKIYKDYGD